MKIVVIVSGNDVILHGVFMIAAVFEELKSSFGVNCRYADHAE